MNDRIWIQKFNSEIHESDIPDRWRLHVDKNLVENNNAKYFSQKTFGSFRCPDCNRPWNSLKAFILFRMTLNTYQRCGNVTMRIFKQGCQLCTRVQEPTITSENMERVITNVVGRIQKVFYKREDVNKDRPPRNYGNLDGPHDSELCEACQYNLCDRQTMSSQQQQQSFLMDFAHRELKAQESQESSSSTAGAITAAVVGVGALALMFLSMNKTKENKRGAP